MKERCSNCGMKDAHEPWCKFGVAAPSVSRETSAGQTPELIKPPFQKALTVIMFRDESDKRAEKDVDAILEGSTVFRIGVPELYFHHLRLRVAKDPTLAEKIAVFYVDGSGPQHVDISKPQYRWPVGFGDEIWNKETEIQQVGLSFDDELKWPAGFCQETLGKEIDIRHARKDKK